MYLDEASLPGRVQTSAATPMLPTDFAAASASALTCSSDRPAAAAAPAICRASNRRGSGQGPEQRCARLFYVQQHQAGNLT